MISEVCILSPGLLPCGQLHSWLQVCVFAPVQAFKCADLMLNNSLEAG